MSTPICPDGLSVDLIMFPLGPVLPQVQVLNLLGCPPHLQPPLGKLQLDAKRLHLIEELVDLRQSRLALFVEGAEVVDLCHISSVVLGECIEPLAKCGKGGGRSHECREKPS
jgi:hypothetical protein